MAIFSWLRPKEQPRAVKSFDINTILRRLDTASDSGVVVSENAALRVSTAYACVSRISLDVAAMPFHIREQSGDGSVVAKNAREHQLLFRRPNPWQTAFEFRQMVTAQAVLRGNGYAYKVRDGMGRTLELWPLKATECTPERVGGKIMYTVNAYDGKFVGRFDRDRIFHLRGFTWDGLTGLDRVFSAQDSIGLSSAAEGTQAKSFKNGTRMPGYWSTDQSLSDEVLNRLADSLSAATTGENQFKSPLLDTGIGYNTTGQNFNDAQLIETRKHQITEVCAAFNVLPAILGIDDKTQAFASVEAMFRAHLQHTLRPWLVNWEQSVDRDLLDAEGPMFAKHDTSDMEKASTAERAESYRNLLETFVMMPNEARELEGLPAIPGLDEEWRKIRRGMAGLDKEGPANGED